MDALAARALKIQRRRDELIGEFPSLWQGMIKAWCEPAEEPGAWLMPKQLNLHQTEIESQITRDRAGLINIFNRILMI